MPSIDYSICGNPSLILLNLYPNPKCNYQPHSFFKQDISSAQESKYWHYGLTYYTNKHKLPGCNHGNWESKGGLFPMLLFFTDIPWMWSAISPCDWRSLLLTHSKRRRETRASNPPIWGIFFKWPRQSRKGERNGKKTKVEGVCDCRWIYRIEKERYVGEVLCAGH